MATILHPMNAPAGLPRPGGRRLGRALPLLLLTVLALQAAPARVGARTLSVPGDASTIASAVAQAQHGDLILVACGTYREHDIVLKAGIKLWSGTLQPDCTIIDAGGRGRIFDLADADSTTAIVGLTLRGGRAHGDGLSGCGGAIRLQRASPKLSNCRIIDCSARLGGGIYADDGSAPLIQKTEFRGDQAAAAGGGLYWSAVEAGRITDSHFEDNAALRGAGMYVVAAEDLPLTRCVFVFNVAANAGGALFLDQASPLLRNALLVQNWGGLSGGAIACSDAAPHLINSTLCDNGAEYEGGGVVCRRSSPLLEHCIVAFNAPDAVTGDADSKPRLIHCNLFANLAGDWTGLIQAQEGRRNNFSRDPSFCDRDVGNFHLRADSWCLPGTSATGRDELVGALGGRCSGRDVLFPGGVDRRD